jgi:hypothetical protein
MSLDNKVITNPIAPLISGLKGNYGVFWQVISFCLCIYAYRMFSIAWHGLNGNGCSEGARIELTNPDTTTRAVACGTRAVLELIAGDNPTTENSSPTATPTPPPSNLIEQPD